MKKPNKLSIVNLTKEFIGDTVLKDGSIHQLTWFKPTAHEHLLDVTISKPRLLVDNSETPHEFHMHTSLPESKLEKVFLGTYDYSEALKIFYEEVKRIVNES